MEYADPEQSPYTIHWPVKLFSQEFFNSSLCSLLGQAVFSMTEKHRDRLFVKQIIQEMEETGFLLKDKPKTIEE
mgnify:CR=1 FL=1